MFETEWIQAMQAKTSQVLDQLAPEDYWFKLKENALQQQVWYIVEKEGEVLIKKIVWELEKDNKKYFGPGYAARLLISSFDPQLSITERKLTPVETALYHQKRQQLQLPLPSISGILLGSMGISLEIRQTTYQVELVTTNLDDWPELEAFLELLEGWLLDEY